MITDNYFAMSLCLLLCFAMMSGVALFLIAVLLKVFEFKSEKDGNKNGYN